MMTTSIGSEAQKTCSLENIVFIKKKNPHSFFKENKNLFNLIELYSYTYKYSYGLPYIYLNPII